jgi:hypothetical protein
MPWTPDRTLANERTALGWQRAALSLAVIGGLVLTAGIHRREPLAIVAAMPFGVAALAAFERGRRLYRRRGLAGGPGAATAGEGGVPPAVAPIRRLVAVTVVAAAVAAAIVIGGR